MLTTLLKPDSTKTDSGSIEFIVEKILSGKVFIELVTITHSCPETQIVDVRPLVARSDNEGKAIANSVVHGIAYIRWQCGGSAVIMDPLPGDIGLMAVCDRDSSAVRLSRQQSLPVSRDNHSRTDGIYLGGLLNMIPTQFIEFARGSINITTLNEVNITCNQAIIKAGDGIKLDTPLAEFTGDIIDNSGSNSSTLKDLRDRFNTHYHQVKGVESGDSTAESEIPNNPAG